MDAGPASTLTIGRVPPEAKMTAALAQEYFIGKRGRIRTYLFELAFGFGFPFLGLQYLLDPSATSAHSVIGRRVYPFDYLWSLGYIVGGLLVIYGVVWGRSRIRAVGFIVLGTALLQQVTASMVNHADLREMFNVVCALACLSRVAMMVKVLLRFREFSRGLHGERPADDACG